MNPNEKELLQKFLQELNSTQLAQKDHDANALIAESSKHQPDALYLLVQRSMGLEMALQVAQQQMTEMQAKINKTSQPATSFLNDNNAWGRPASVASATMPATPNKTGAPASAWGSGMLGAIATTAIGVVAGSMLYQGIQSMMGQSKTEPSTGPLGQADVPQDMQMVSNQPDDIDFGDGFDDGGFV